MNADGLIAAAKAAFPAWSETPVRERCRRLRALRGAITKRRGSILSTLSACTGKPEAEGLLNELIPALELLRHDERHAPGVLAAQKRPTPFLFPRSRSHVEFHPRGVVVVLGPGNFPFQLSLAPAVTALAAGNAVIVKLPPLAAPLAPVMESLFVSAGFPTGIVQVVAGDGALGEALAGAGADLVFLTGGVETGRKVMAACARTITPVILELGGKDPMVVFADCHLERAVLGAVYGAFANGGQICVSVDRVLVERPLFRVFSQQAAAAARALPADAYGPFPSQDQADRFAGIVQDALSKGAVALTPFELRDRRASPVLLAEVNPSMRIWREEVFGPAAVIIPFDSEAEALGLANDSLFGLSASVWTQDLAKGRRVAGRIIAGSCAVNDVIKHIGNPSLPFGGAKASGIGVYHGAEGLRAFSRSLSVVVNAGRWKQEPNWFPYTKRRFAESDFLAEARYSTDGFFRKAAALLRLGRRMKTHV